VSLPAATDRSDGAHALVLRIPSPLSRSFDAAASPVPSKINANDASGGVRGPGARSPGSPCEGRRSLCLGLFPPLPALPGGPTRSDLVAGPAAGAAPRPTTSRKAAGCVSLDHPARRHAGSAMAPLFCPRAGGVEVSHEPWRDPRRGVCVRLPPRCYSVDRLLRDATRDQGRHGQQSKANSPIFPAIILP
jgi:hypothetical protein